MLVIHCISRLVVVNLKFLLLTFMIYLVASSNLYTWYLFYSICNKVSILSPCVGSYLTIIVPCIIRFLPRGENNAKYLFWGFYPLFFIWKGGLCMALREKKCHRGHVRTRHLPQFQIRRVSRVVGEGFCEATQKEK
jgi:hypothetical protein